MLRKDTSLTIRLPSDLKERLHRHAQDESVSVSTVTELVIRRGLEPPPAPVVEVETVAKLNARLDQIERILAVMAAIPQPEPAIVPDHRAELAALGAEIRAARHASIAALAAAKEIPKIDLTAIQAQVAGLTTQLADLRQHTTTAAAYGPMTHDAAKSAREEIYGLRQTATQALAKSASSEESARELRGELQAMLWKAAAIAGAAGGVIGGVIGAVIG